MTGSIRSTPFYPGLGAVPWRMSSDVRLTMKIFEVSRASLYRWRRRYNPGDPSSLEDGSRRPHRIRRHEWSKELEEAARALREQFPRWGKDKLGPLLRNSGLKVSNSTVGRILGDPKRRGRLKEPLRTGGVYRRGKKIERKWAVRMPAGY